MSLSILQSQLEYTNIQFHHGILMSWIENHWDTNDVHHYMSIARGLPSFDAYKNVMQTLLSKEREIKNVWKIALIEEVALFVGDERLDWEIEWYTLSDKMIEMVYLLQLKNKIKESIDENWIRLLIKNHRVPLLKAVLNPSNEHEEKLKNIFEFIGVYGFVEDQNIFYETTLML